MEKAITAARNTSHSTITTRSTAYQSPHFKMREEKHIPATSTASNTQTSPTIPSNTNLSITMTLESKHRRHTKRYRVIERPDGIIVEHPRYRPAGTSQKATKNLKGNPVPSHRIGTQCKHTQGTSSSSMEHDLMGIGMSVCVVPIDVTGSDGHTRLGSGRGGDNEVARERTPIPIIADGCEQLSHAGFTPMARFLSERGPWSSCSFQEDQDKVHGSDQASASTGSKGNAPW
jgi:hypothetical protein